MKVREALREGAAALAGTETPFLDASLLLADALGTDTTSLLASGPDDVDGAALERFRSGLASRSRGLPAAYILGYKEFWGLRFKVDPRVLIPRPDTETLVAAALAMGDVVAGERSLPMEHSPALRVHDVCTGSGCVAISLAADRNEWRVSASDLSEGALEVARSNAEVLLGIGRKGGPVEFARRDLLAVASSRRVFDLVVANPPYVPSSEAEALLTLGWSEPKEALDGGEDGLDLVRRLVPEAARTLAPGGALLVEADGAQADRVAELFRASRFTEIETVSDLGGRPRVTSGRMPWTT
jgi:release factor glutamine methyltransferase